MQNGRHPHPHHPDMKTRRMLLLLILPTLLLVALILSDALPWLRGPAPGSSEWYWPYQLRPLARWWPSLLASLLFLLIGWRWLQPTQTSRRHSAITLVGLTAVTLLLQLSLIYADHPAVLAELIDRTQSDLASGFFMPAAEITDLPAALRNYPALMPTFSAEHARTHPPGLIIANYETIRLFDHFPNLAQWLARRVYPHRCIDLWLIERPFSVAAALFTWAWLPLLAAALTIWPGYALARVWLPSRAARFATLLMATIPALLLFAPKVIQLYPPLVLLTVFLLHQGLGRRNLGLFAAGLMASLATFLSLGNASLALLVGLFALLMLWQHGRFTPRAILVTAVPLLLGSLTIWLGYWAIFAVPPWDIASAGLAQHYQLVTLHRRYDWWLIWNLVDLLVYAGWPLLFGAALALGGGIRALRHRALSPTTALALALALLIVLLDVSGSARGEVGRLWLFFMPLLALPAAAALSKRLPEPGHLLAVIALQLLLAASIGVAWRPVRAVTVIAQRPVMLETAVPATPFSATFTETLNQSMPIRLTGYTLAPAAAQPGEALSLTLFWQADGATIRPYTVFTQLLATDNAIIAQQDNWPVNGQWPPTCWQPNEQIVDAYTLSLPPDTPPGSYRLVIGLYDATHNTRLQTTDGRDALLLQEVPVN